MLLSQFCYYGKYFELGLVPCTLPPDTYYMYDADGWYTHIKHEYPEYTMSFTQIEPPQFEPGKTRPKFNTQTNQWTVQLYAK